MICAAGCAHETKHAKIQLAERKTLKNARCFTLRTYLRQQEVQPLIHNFVQRILNDALRAGGFEFWNDFANDVLINDCFHCHPAFLAQT